MRCDGPDGIKGLRQVAEEAAQHPFPHPPFAHRETGVPSYSCLCGHGGRSVSRLHRRPWGGDCRQILRMGLRHRGDGGEWKDLSRGYDEMLTADRRFYPRTTTTSTPTMNTTPLMRTGRQRCTAPLNSPGR